MKRKLLFAAVALLCSVGAWAQSLTPIDVTTSYIGDVTWIVNGGGWHGNCSNNHKESNGIGWWNNQTITGNHAFANPTTDGAPGESWSPSFGSAGVMMGRTMVLPAGNYTLSFDAFACNAGNSEDPSTLPSAGDAIAFLTREVGVDITNISAAGDNTFHRVSFTFDVATDNTEYEFGIKKLTDESKIDWCQIKNVTLTLNSTNITPIANNEITSFVYNGSQTWHTNTWSVEGQSDGTRFQVPFHELWVSSGNKLDDATITGSYTPTQTGVYRVSAWVRAYNESAGDISGATFFVGSTETDACGGTDITKEENNQTKTIGKYGTLNALIGGLNGTPFNYGFKLKDAEINWLSFKNVTITYIGNDLTSCMINAAVTSTTGWTNGRIASNQQYTEAPDNTYLDTWDGTLDQYQYVDLPAGSYLLKCATRADATITTNPNVYVYSTTSNENVASAPVHQEGGSGNLLGNGWAWSYVPFTLNAATRVKIGFWSNCNGAKWAAADDFHLTYYSSELEMKQGHLASVVSDANAWAEKLTTTAALKSALSASAPACATVEECNTAISNLTTTIANARASEAAYATFNALKIAANAIAAVEYKETTSGSHATFALAISTQTTAVEDATTADAINTAISDLKTAIKTYIAGADPTSGNRFDITCLVVNPDLSIFPAWTAMDAVDGWSSDQPDGNRNTQINNGVACSEGNAFFEYWSGTPKANGEFALYNTVEALPEGTYTIDCYALATANGYEQATTSAVYFYANDTQGSLVSADVLTAATISFINNAEQDVKIGLKPLKGNTFRWMGIGYLKLYKEYTDNTTYSITANVTANGTVAVTVDNEAATETEALKTVKLTITPDAGYAVSSVVATYNDGETKNLDVANPSTNVYTFQMPAYDVTATITTVVDKSALATALASATSARKSANEGSGIFQIPAAAGATFASAISAAQSVYDNSSATVSEVATAVTTLNGATTTYEGTTLNAPDASKRYYLTIVEDGKDWNGNAVTFIAGGRSGEGDYAIKYLTPANANYCQAIKFTATTGNRYKMSVVRADGDEQYLTTNSLAYGSNTAQIRTTTDASKALEVEIKATTSSGQFLLYNTEAEAVIANNNNYDMYTAYSANFTIAEASQARVTGTVKANKFGTVIFPFTPEAITGVEFYYLSTVDDQSGRTQADLVEEPTANVPYLLRNTTGSDVPYDQSGWGLATQDRYTVDLMTGVYTASTIPVGSYVLQTQNGKQAFYKVEEGTTFTATPYRAYMTKAAGEAKAIFIDFDDTATGIDSMIESKSLLEGEAYDMSGRRVLNPTRGLYIINGKKVLLK